MLKVLNSPTKSEISTCINKKIDFQVSGGSQSKNVSLVESMLENTGYDVRVKTKGREASLIVPNPLNAINWIGQMAHNIATYDPDWVIYKHAFGSKIDVKYFED